jgi:hypothetical protein
LAVRYWEPLPMPVTAKLSRKFYERLGDEIATELVDWFNAVDAAYRADLERLNELNFQRFDAKVEQRFAEFETRFSEFQARIEQQLAAFEVKIEQRLAEARVEVANELGAMRHVLADQHTKMTRWMFGFWIGTVVPLAGLIVALRLL